MEKISLIGVCGGSASGKSTLAARLRESLGPANCSLISLDNYYRDFVKLGRDPSRVNYDHPDSFDIKRLSHDLKRLLGGHPTEIPVYDFKTHTRSNRQVIIHVSPYVIVEGLFLFNLNKLEITFDHKIYVNTPARIRLIRRIRRDSRERGRSIASIFWQYVRFVSPMHKLYVLPNRELADHIVDGTSPYDSALQGMNIRH
jgi:uridine kinase